ncbi:hypothetical protein DXG03_004829 [Asterophora parasitica]|uniref:Plasma membrane fusion protein PRM1 n=1 Tax=Asterophora parasitica TaxID=117018 RepID=A0A9P7G0P6_9AGAR|nr:hypothetical protein DXG03_004829 [Asterophora parasitica]
MSWNAPPTYDAHSQVSTLTPYLQLSHRLSLTWLAYPILSLLFIAFRLQLSLASANDSVASAKSNLLASCKAAEKAATAASSLPRYLAIASNDQIVDAVNATLRGVRATLVLALTIMEVVINFIIDIYRSTLLCFLELVVRGGLAILIGAVDELNKVVTTVATGLRNSIQKDIEGANSVISKAIEVINRINPLGNIPTPSISVPNLDGLENVSLPDSFQQGLTNLNRSLPTVAELKNKIESIIDKPFELLKKDINDTFNSISFNSSVLPVPQTNQLTFCNDMDLSVVDDVGRDLIKTAKIGIIILILLALLLIGLNCLLEWWKWLCLKAHLQYTREAWTSDPTMVHQKGSGTPSVTLNDHNLMVLNANSDHPLITRILNNMSKVLRLTPRQHTHLQWFCHYIFYPPALACFLIGLLGLLSIQIQLAAMGPLVARYQERTTNTTSDFSNTIFTAINASMYDQSAAYANDVNGRVISIETTINEGMFGWVNVTTEALNTTIVTFYDDVQSAVGAVFDGTILENPAREFLRCLIGTKVEAIEKALTFLHDHLVVNMPRVNQTVLVMSPEHVSEAANPISEAAVGGGENGDGGLILRIINNYAERLRKERLMFAIFLGLWGLVVLMGLWVVWWHSYGKDMVEARKRRRWEREQRGGIQGLVVPFRDAPPPVSEKQPGVHNNLPAFTPLPSPKDRAFELKPFAFMNRNASKTEVNDSREAEQGGSNWAATFKDRFVAPPSNKFMAIGRRAIGKEQLKEDGDEKKDPAPSSSNIPDDSSKRNTSWFGRMSSMRDKKQTDPSPERPKLRIRPTAVIDSGSNERPSSRWSYSPVEPLETRQFPPPWKSLVKKTQAHPYEPVGLPARPKLRHDTSDGGSTSSDATLIAPMMPTPFAPPIHLGFDDSRYPKLRSAPTPVPAPTVAKSQSQEMLLAPSAPGYSRHRRTPSVPIPTDATSITPITRLLTNIHGRQSSSESINPFVTPFDDEYRVTIAHPTHTRESIPTNPFLGPPVAI